MLLALVSLVLSSDDTGWIYFECNNVTSQLDLLAPLQGCNLNPACRRGQDELYNDQCQPVIWNHTHINKDNVCLLTEANTLSLCGFNITHLETGSFSCQHDLITLHLSHNKIKQLVDGVFDGMTFLRQVWLDNNLIHTIGNNVFPTNLKSLQVIDLSYNKLTYLEPWFFLLPELILINASNNVIHQFVNTIGFNIIIKPVTHSENLTIDLDRNEFEYAQPEDFFSYLGVQNIAVPELNIWNMYTSRKICARLWDNPFVCDCRMFSMYNLIKDFTDIFQVQQEVVICSAPQVLYNQSMRLLAPEQLICDLSNETCPLNCSCIYIPAKQIIEIDCTTSQLTSLPHSLPRYLDPLEVQLSINFTGNKITHLQNTSYLGRTQVLDVGNNNIASIDNNVVESWQEIEEIYLQNNLLTLLPREWKDQSWRNLKSVSIYGNPFVCNCSLNWLNEWSRTHTDKVVMMDSITCVKNERHIVLSEWENALDCDSSDAIMLIVVIISVFVVFIVCLFIFVVKYKHRMIHFLREHDFLLDNLHKEYDAFVCFADEDLNFIEDTIIPLLENDETKYKLLLHYRDFLFGRPIVQNIAYGLEHSKRVMFIVSRYFLESDWCIFELRSAGVPDKSSRNILIILMEDFENHDIHETLRVLLNTVTCLKLNDRQFSKKLKDAMPAKRKDDEQ